MREVSIANHHPRLRVDRAAVARVIHVLDAHASEIAGQKTSSARTGSPSPVVGELSLVFLTDPALAQLHGRFLGDPTTTDVITFEGNPAHGVAGEICVSADTAATFARRHARDFGAELTLYIVHGWLHLAGFDDLVPAKKRAMRRAEARAMRLLELNDAVPKFRLNFPAPGR